MLSIPHMIVVFIVVLVVFGPQKLPELARTFGKLMAEFRKASNDFKSAFEEEMRDLEQALGVATAPAVLVANEVGSGIVPSFPLGRRFRDMQGILNQRIAARADRVVLMVAGLPVPIKGTL